MKLAITTDQRFITDGTSAVKVAGAQTALYHDSKDLVTGSTGVDFFLPTAGNDRLAANYHKNPFLGSDQFTRVEQIGFSFNAQSVLISGATATEANEKLVGFLNNLASATIEYGEGPGNCASGELRLIDFAAFRYEVVNISTTANIVVLRDTPLTDLPKVSVIRPGNNFQARVRMYASTYLPAANGVPGVPGATLKIIAQINVSHYTEAQRQAVQQAVQAPATGGSVRPGAIDWANYNNPLLNPAALAQL